MLHQGINHCAERLCNALQVTGKFFEMGESFNLGDLLKLELHNAVEECREIVDRAQKELVIEKSLRKIEDTWAGLKLSFAPYQVLTGLCKLLYIWPTGLQVSVLLMQALSSNL